MSGFAGAATRRGKYHLSAENYGDFLIRLFDLWYEDLQRGEYISVRHLDNWLSILLGGQPEACSMTGQCAVQFVVEGDGGVYPCDFYVLDEWRMGTVGESSFAEMQRGEVAAGLFRHHCACRTNADAAAGMVCAAMVVDGIA